MPTLRIQHETRYRYARPVTFGRHRLVLRPREGHEQQVERMTLTISPAHEASWARDVFGNSILIVDFTEPAELLSIHSDVILARRTPFPREVPHEPWRIAYPVTYDTLELTIAGAYQAPSYPDDLDVIREWLTTSALPAVPEDAEVLLAALGERIFKSIQYRRRPERGVQTPAQTLQLQSGSCRDMATLMMEAARALGVAARFASGYLDCRASEAGRAAMHAWTEVYLPTLGWRGFDPTLGEPTSLKHVVVGVSNHPRGVMPVSGMFSGSSADYVEMIATVKIEKIEPTPAADAAHTASQPDVTGQPEENGCEQPSPGEGVSSTSGNPVVNESGLH